MNKIIILTGILFLAFTVNALAVTNNTTADTNLTVTVNGVYTIATSGGTPAVSFSASDFDINGNGSTKVLSPVDTVTVQTNKTGWTLQGKVTTAPSGWNIGVSGDNGTTYENLTGTSTNLSTFAGQGVVYNSHV